MDRSVFALDGCQVSSYAAVHTPRDIETATRSQTAVPSGASSPAMLQPHGTRHLGEEHNRE